MKGLDSADAPARHPTSVSLARQVDGLSLRVRFHSRVRRWPRSACSSAIGGSQPLRGVAP
jgi:hypothetical protein